MWLLVACRFYHGTPMKQVHDQLQDWHQDLMPWQVSISFIVLTNRESIDFIRGPFSRGLKLVYFLREFLFFTSFLYFLSLLPFSTSFLYFLSLLPFFTSFLYFLSFLSLPPFPLFFLYYSSLLLHLHVVSRRPPT